MLEKALLGGQMGRDKFLKGAFILTVAGILVKIIGSANRIFLSRLLGGEGIGLYQMAYPIYLLALSISSAGIPVAISIIVAERLALGDYRGANRVFKISLALMSITGLVFASLLFFGADFLVNEQIVRDPRAYYSIISLAPAVFFATMLSSYRGYFQGYQMMTPTASSQIIEQFIRVMTMISFAYLLLPMGIEYSAAGASFGAAPGALCGLLVLLYCYFKHQKTIAVQIATQKETKLVSAKTIVNKIVRLALPVSLANIMIPVVSSLDMLIVPKRLEVAGFGVEQATTLFGYLTGMGLPLIMMATIPTASLAASIVPAISEAYTLTNYESVNKKIATALRLCALITIPASLGLLVLATPISQMLYATPTAGTSIAVLAPAIFFLGLHQVTTGILQGLGKTIVPVINMIISAGVKVLLAWILTANPSYGIIGAAFATDIDFLLAVVLNVLFLKKQIRVNFPIKDILRITLSAIIMGYVVHWSHGKLIEALMSNSLATLSSIILGGMVYCLMLVITGSISAQEIRAIPVVGNKLANTMLKLRLIRE